MLSKKIKKFRENNGFTQKQVADAINVERSTYAYYETGKTTPDIDTIIQLAKIFNVHYTDLLEDEIRTSIGSFYDVSYENHFFEEDPEIKESIYDLKKDEKTLLCFYRALSEENKDKFLKNISKYFKKQNKNKK